MKQKLLATCLGLGVALQSICVPCVNAESTNVFSFSQCLEQALKQANIMPTEVDDSLFEKFLKYSLLVADKDALTPDELARCYDIFLTERSYMPYITCPYARAVIRDGITAPRTHLTDLKMHATLACMTTVAPECYAYLPDIQYVDENYFTSDAIAEYWVDDAGTERIISAYSSVSPYYEKWYAEEPDLLEQDRLVEYCWNAKLTTLPDGSSLYTGDLNGKQYEDLLYPEQFTSDIWIYQLMEDDSAFIIGTTLPTSSRVEPIEEPTILPDTLDGHPVYGINNALSRTGITKLVIPEQYQYVGYGVNMPHLREIEIHAPSLRLHGGFMSCPVLESAILDVKSIGSSLFHDCDSLQSVTILHAEHIGTCAFQNLPALTTVTLPPQLRSIGQDAFTGTAVKELVIPSETEIVGAVRTPYFLKGELIDPLTADRIAIADADCVIKSDYQTEAHRYALANGYRFEPLNAEANGDVNGDGQLSIADLLVLQKWLLCEQPSQNTNQYAADYNMDGRLNAADVSLMKRALLYDAESERSTP